MIITRNIPVLQFNLGLTYQCLVLVEQNDVVICTNLNFSTKNHQSSLIRRLLFKHDTISHNSKEDVIILRNQHFKEHLKVNSLDKINSVYSNNSNETYYIVCFLKIHALDFCFYVLVTRLETSKFYFFIFASVNLRLFLKKVLLNKHVAQRNFYIQHVSFRYCKSILSHCRPTLFFRSKYLLNHVYRRLYFVSICLPKYNLRNQLYHSNHIKRHRKLKDKSSDCNFVKQIDLKNLLNQCQLKEERKLYLYLQDERGKKSIKQTELEIAKPDSCVSKGSDSNNESNDCASLELSKAVKLSLYSQLWWPRNTTLNLIAYPLHNASRQPSENPSPSTPAQQNPQTRDVHRLMHFEVFRLCSFSYSRFPPNVNLWVTLLAQSGFYVVNDSGRVRCFSCGYEYEDFLIGSPVDNAHGPQCERHTFNRPLHEWIRGLDRDVLESYYLVFGNLRPYVSDDSENLDHLNSSAQAVLHEDPTHLESGFSETEARQMGGPSLGSADSQDPQSYQRAADAVVYQESQEPQPREVLTSAAQQPVTLDRSVNGASADQTHPDTERGATGYTNFDLSLASYPQFAGTSSRRSTFSGWNPEHPQKPDDLVAGGFFYAGYADCVRCFYCGLGLKYWRPDDIPAYQHARFRPNCVYNRMYKGQEYIDRVQQDNQQDAGNNVERNQSQTANPAPQPTTNQPPNPPPNVAVTTEHAHLRLPASQEASRAGWRSDQIIPAVTHIIDELGIDGQNLSYEILLDVLVQLYSANDAPNLGSDRSEGSVDSNHGGQSSDGVVDSSIPTLRFPQDVSASEKLRTLNDGVEVADSAEPAPVTTAGPATATTTTSRHNDQEQFRAVENEHNYLTQRSLCGICHQRPLHCVFLPCGHVIACQECAEAATKCPICNKNVAATANVYLS